MTVTFVAARLVLTAVFAVAAVAKLAGRERFRGTLGAFGVSRPFLTPGVWLIAAAELTLAGLLVPPSTGRPAALAAATLTAVFSAVAARALASGKRPDCGCFGSLSSAPIGWTTLARNAALVALAVAVATRPARALGWVDVAAAAAAALFALQGWLWFELLRRYGRALGRIAALEARIEPRSLDVGDEAPLFALPDLDGRLVSLEMLLEQSGETVLLFTNPHCGACGLVLGEADAHGDMHLVVVGSGDPEAVAAAAGYDAGTVLVDERREVAPLYGVAVVPTAVLLDDEGRVADGPAVGTAEVRELMQTASSLRLAGEAA